MDYLALHWENVRLRSLISQLQADGIQHAINWRSCNEIAQHL